MQTPPFLTLDPQVVPPPKVVVVSTSPWVARALSAVLDGAGFAPLAVREGRSAADLCASDVDGTVAAVVLDLRGNGVDTETIGAITRAGATRLRPVLALIDETPSSALATSFFRAGGWGWVLFPVGGGHWLHQLQSWTRAAAVCRN